MIRVTGDKIHVYYNKYTYPYLIFLNSKRGNSQTFTNNTTLQRSNVRLIFW